MAQERLNLPKALFNFQESLKCKFTEMAQVRMTTYSIKSTTLSVCEVFSIALGAPGVSVGGSIDTLNAKPVITAREPKEKTVGYYVAKVL